MAFTNAQIAKIRTLLAKLPDDKYRERDLTRDQLRLWISQRAMYELVALCWEAFHKGIDNPLPALVDEGILDPTLCKFCGLLAERYQHLWWLVFSSEADIRKASARLGIVYPFSSALELFRHIVQEQAAREFEVCLDPYIEVSAPKLNSMLREEVKVLEAGLPKLSIHQPSDTQITDSVRYLKTKCGDSKSWTTYLWCTWEVLAQSREDIKRNIAAYDGVMVEIVTLGARTIRKAKSIAWKKGQKGTTVQKGGFYVWPECSHDPKTLEAHFDLNQAILPQIRNNS